MRFTTVITTAIAASVAIAAPLQKRAAVTTWVVDTITVTDTVYASPPAATPSPVGGIQLSSSPAPAPAPTTTSPPPPPATSTQAPPPPAVTTTAAAAPPAQSPSSGSTTANYGACEKFVPGTTPDFNTPPVSCGVSVLDTLNQWRAWYGKAPLQWSATMAEAAWNTLVYNKGGVTEVHPGLVDGSMGEVLSPGFTVPASSMNLQGDTPFGVAMVNWLCEVPSDPQLQASGPTGVDQCLISSQQASIEENPGETGHHDILLGDYTYAACLFRNNDNGDGGWPQFEGLWGCDFN